MDKIKEAIDWKDRFYELEEGFEEREKALIQEIEHWKFMYYKKGTSNG